MVNGEKQGITNSAMKFLFPPDCGASVIQSLHYPLLVLTQTDCVYSYVGEVGIWTGIYALSTVSLQSPMYPSWTILLAAASPLSIYFLLRYVSALASDYIGIYRGGSGVRCLCP